MDCQKMRLGLLVLFFFLCCLLIARTEAQLNFSTGWGKRSGTATSDSYSQAAAPRPFKLQHDADQILRFYRLLRRIEAEQSTDSQE